jgi:hypothetical protein
LNAVTALAERIPRRARGLLLGLIAALSFTLLHTSVRYASRELHVFEITFFRYFIALFFMLPGLLGSRFAVLRTQRLHLHLIRCVMLMISMLGLFSALTMSPISMVTALSFVSPVFASVVAISQVVQALQARGLQRGDAVATLSGNRPEAFLITAAAYLMGLRLTWVNPTSSEDDHAYILQDSGVTTLFVDPRLFSDRARTLQARVPGLQR